MKAAAAIQTAMGMGPSLGGNALSSGNGMGSRFPGAPEGFGAGLNDSQARSYTRPLVRSR
jgi:hypothetical protein